MYLSVVGQQLIRIEDTINKLVRRLNGIVPNLNIEKGKSVVKIADKVNIKPNPDITGFKMKDTISSEIIKALSKKA